MIRVSTWVGQFAKGLSMFWLCGHWLLATTACSLNQEIFRLDQAGNGPGGPAPLVCDDTITDNFGGGEGTPENPYRICTSEQWKSWVASGINLDKAIKLEADIDLSTFTEADMLATGATAFTGSLDGGGHRLHGLDITATAPYALIKAVEGDVTISNLNLEDITINSSGGTTQFAILVLTHTAGTLSFENIDVATTSINISGASPLGVLVGRAYVLNASDINLDQISITVSGAQGLGVIAGSASGVTISGVTASSITINPGSSSDDVGTLVGKTLNLPVDISDVSITGLIIPGTISYYIGGILGSAARMGIPGLCPEASFRNIRILSNIAGGSFCLSCGGIVGELVLEDSSGTATFEQIRFANSATMNASNSGAAGVAASVYGSGSSVLIKEVAVLADFDVWSGSTAGMIAYTDADIAFEDSYVRGQIRGTHASGFGNFGGLVASHSGSVSISRSYYSGIQTVANTGTIRGCIQGNGVSNTYQDVYYDNTNCPNQVINSSAAAGATGVSEASMKNGAAFTGWSTDIWEFPVGDLPRLKWEP